MKTRTIFGFAAIVLLMSACDDLFGDDPKTEYTAVMEAVSGPANETLNWINGDPVFVISEGGKKTERTTITVNGSNATFGLREISAPKYALYPEIDHTYPEGVITIVRLPEVYEQYNGNMNAPMFADMSDGGNVANFRHLAGVLKVAIKGIPAGVDRMVFTSKENITGMFEVDITAANPEIVLQTGPGVGKTVTFNIEPTAVNDAKTFYVPLPVGTYTGFDIRLFAGDDSVYERTIGRTTYKIERTTLAALPVLDCTEQPDLSDLSSGDCANSYIVPSAGTYHFLATHKGNSVDDADKLGTIASVKVLWETYGTNEPISEKALISSCSVKDNVITFTATEKKGNALIAALDASNKILWSWHIWLTDMPENQVYLGDAGTMMDRNLGATSANPDDGVKTFGLLYQWGRKDPFFGSQYTKYKVNAPLVPNTAGIDTYGNGVNGVAGPKSSDWAAQNPTTFVYDLNFYDWHTSEDSSSAFERWGYFLRYSYDPIKTINDPCPPGYRVPVSESSSGIWYDGFNSAGGGYSFFTDTSADFTSDNANKGIDFAATTPRLMDNGVCWYPAPGILGCRDGALYEAGGYGYYHSAYPAHLYVGQNGRVTIGGLDESRAYGYSVRCQKL